MDRGRKEHEFNLESKRLLRSARWPACQLCLRRDYDELPGSEEVRHHHRGGLWLREAELWRRPEEKWVQEARRREAHDDDDDAGADAGADADAGSDAFGKFFD